MKLLAIRPVVEEILSQGCLQRPDVPLTPGVVLGRNSISRITDPSISRRVCTLVYSSNGWNISLIQRNSTVTVNGQSVQPGMHVLLKHCDEIALGPGGMYSYRVDLTDENDVADPLMNLPMTINDRKRNASREPVQQQQQQLSNAARRNIATTATAQVLEECSCAICLDLQVQSTCIVPCGHSFCQQCVANETTCPTCRGTIESRVPCFALSAVVLALTASGLLSSDDLQAYQQRRAVPAYAVVVMTTGQSVADAIVLD
jgi:hypothetical protein